jgi:ABC-type uncharacterized transport system permease subunit
MYDIGLFLFTGAGWACRIPSVFTQIYLCFQQPKTSFLLCLIERVVSAPSSACGLGLVYFPTALFILALSSLYPGIVITSI